MTKWIDWREVYAASLLDVPDAKNRVGNQGTKTKKRILDILCAWDIETSRVPGTEYAACYQWQLQVGTDYPTIRGRELWEFRQLMDSFASAIEKGRTLYIFVHNLAYEFHFLRAVYPELNEKDVFSLKPRAPVKVKLYDGKIELRCSYILTNMSLSEWTRKMNVEHGKLSGSDFDYDAIRYPWTELTAEQLEYCRNDVLGLVEALRVQLDVNDDTLSSIPLTSTGYIRRAVKAVMRNWSYFGMQAVQPSDEVYIALREAFRGGDTHCNRYFAGVILNDVKSADKSSAYPDACVNYEFPMGTFRKSRKKSLTRINQLMTLHRALLIRMRFVNIRLRDEYDPCPYISYAKIRGVNRKDCRLDNGRILAAPYCEMTFTDIDWEIIKAQYIWDNAECTDLWETRYGLLPDMLRSLINSYYEDKTRLKGVDGQEVYYMKSKNLLNSIYGLQAQDPCKMTTVYDPEGNREKLPEEKRKKLKPGPREIFYVAEGDIAALLAKSRNRPYGTYQWGVWCTAIARRELRKMINAAGDNFVYCDTDSVKYLGELNLEKYNREKVRQSTANGAFAKDPKGVTHYMGVFEDDGTYQRFVSYGSKKYAYEDDYGLHITVAGAGKKAGAQELAEAGGLEAFKTGFVFVKGGGTEAVYNDHTNAEFTIDGHKLYVGPNIYLKPSTYTLGVTQDYKDILDNAELIRGIIHERNLKKALSATGTK